MKLEIIRNTEKENGFSIVDTGTGKTILMINGNDHDYNGPIAITSIDPYILFGLSSPRVVNRIIGEQKPQTLLTTKELSHTLFEHGMKSCWGKIKLNQLEARATSSTFYWQFAEIHNKVTMSVVKKDDHIGILLADSYLVSESGFVMEDKPYYPVSLSQMRDRLTLE